MLDLRGPWISIPCKWRESESYHYHFSFLFNSLLHYLNCIFTQYNTLRLPLLIFLKFRQLFTIYCVVCSDKLLQNTESLIPKKLHDLCWKRKIYLLSSTFPLVPLLPLPSTLDRWKIRYILTTEQYILTTVG